MVLVDFWTYSCINCLRTLPYLKKWDALYRKRGLVIVGVHTPEFAFEHDLGNVREAVRRLKLRYPVALDNDYGTWKAYGNNYWPAHYLIDQAGRVREIHIGEGDYDRTERSIRLLLEGRRKRSAPTRLPRSATERRTSCARPRRISAICASGTTPARRSALTVPRSTRSRRDRRATRSRTQARGRWKVNGSSPVGTPGSA